MRWNISEEGCVMHVIHNSLKYVSHQDIQEFSRDVKPVYKAATEKSALMALDDLKGKWGDEYPLAVSVWERNWDRISTPCDAIAKAQNVPLHRRDLAADIQHQSHREFSSPVAEGNQESQSVPKGYCSAETAISGN
jgi:transposase-like protein